ncbi:MAG: serine hydrolase domain-containing protein [Pyrinomonadaceae bacterium]
MRYFLLLLVFATTLFAQTSLPDTPAGKRAAAFLEMANSSGDDALKKFILENMTPNPDLALDKRVERFRGIRDDMAGAKLVQVLNADAEGITFSLTNNRGEAFRMQLELGEEDKIGGIRVDALGDGGGAQKPQTARVPESQFLAAVEKYLADIVREDKFSGTVLIAKGGKPVFVKAFGMASKEKKLANRIDTKYNLGSINKVFTMLAVGMLADEGKLSLDDKLGKILPDYPNADAREKVTIRHLLAMTSGVGDFFGPEYDAMPKAKLRNNSDFIPLFSQKPLLFEPGKGRRYSNGGYVLLGAIIEKISGKSYYDFVRTRIFIPIGMPNTESYFSDAKTLNLAMGYTREIDAKKWSPNTTTRPARGSSAGGGYSTAQDLLKFANAIDGKTFKVPAALLSVQDPMVGGMFQGGLGFAGGAPGINSMIDSALPGGYTVIVLSNYDPPAAESVSEHIRALLGAN